MKTGVVTDPSFERLERACAQGLHRRDVPGERGCLHCGRATGRACFGGIEPASPATSPDFTRPCGMSAE